MKSLITVSLILLSTVFALPAAIDHDLNMKLVLPDGIFPEDVSRLQAQQFLVPMIVMDENDLPPVPVAKKKPIDKHQVPEYRAAAYKNLGISSSPVGFNPLTLTPLLPEDQELLNEIEEIETAKAKENDKVLNAAAAKPKVKEVVALSDDGQIEYINIPLTDKKAPTREVMESSMPDGVSEQKLVAMDENGRTLHIVVPAYNRGSSLK